MQDDTFCDALFASVEAHRGEDGEHNPLSVIILRDVVEAARVSAQECRRVFVGVRLVEPFYYTQKISLECTNTGGRHGLALKISKDTALC